MITKKQVADLRPGDVVEIRCQEWHANTVLRGSVERDADALVRVGPFSLAYPDGGFAELLLRDATLTVVSRAPRPLYVNHDRAEPVPGDVVREEDPEGPTVWLMDSFRTWQSKDSTHEQDRGFEWPLLLLVDGETGRAVTS